MISATTQLLALGYTFIAAVCGALIGAERRHAEKPTGMRTHALIAAASALIVSIGAVVEQASGRGDPTRTLHGVITGIGFLGAGAIYLRGTRSPGGITTAATVFLTAIVGATVGLGAPIAAFGATVLSLAILRLMPKMLPDPAGSNPTGADALDESDEE